MFMVLVIKNRGKKDDTNVLLRHFREDQMSQYGGLFTHDPYDVKPQWRYTGAPDADARTIQATY